MEIGKVDLRGLEPGTPGWARARASVTASMAAHGCVVVAHDALGPELRHALFGRALPELFGLPFDAKKRSGAFSNGPHRGYEGQVPAVALETVPVPGAADEPGRVRALAGRLWPDGNPDFCDTIVSFAKNVLDLEQTVERMVLEGLGARGESIASQLGSQSHAVRATLYGAPPPPGEEAAAGGVSLSLHAHRDEHMTTVIAQHEVVTNGRVPACVHRVRAPAGGGRGRFSVLLARRRKDDGDPVLRAMDELVDEDHPLMYKPCNHEEYRAFRYSDEGRRLRESHPLKAFCGVEKLGVGSVEGPLSNRHPA